MSVTSVDHQVRGVNAPSYRLSIEAAGVLTLVLGAWAGLVAYAAPAFGFSADGSGSWTWSNAHSLLFLAPGAGAFLAGLIMTAEAPSWGPARRSMLGFAGLLAVASGAWLVVGPVAWPVLHGTSFFAPAASHARELAYWLAYSLGPGALVLALGGFVLGRPHAVATPPTVGAATSPRPLHSMQSAPQPAAPAQEAQPASTY